MCSVYKGVYVELFTQHIHWLHLLHVCDSWIQVHGNIPWQWNLFCIQRKVNLGKFRWRIVGKRKGKKILGSMLWYILFLLRMGDRLDLCIFFCDSLPCCKAVRFYSSAEGWWEKIWSFGDLQEREAPGELSGPVIEGLVWLAKYFILVAMERGH